MNTKCFCTGVLLLIAATTAYGAEGAGVSGRTTLETVRKLVAHNEALINPIKMKYTVKFSRTGEPPEPAGGGRKAGRRYSHSEWVWAQAGQKHYAREDYFYGPSELARSFVKVFEPERVTQGKLPDLMEGTIRPRDSRDWYSMPVAKLGLRVFEGDYTLSQILVPEHASLHTKTETIEGRETYVVDAKRPTIPAYFVRIWIDLQCGMPLRIWYFDRHPNWGDEKSTSQINDVKLHQLPNGGWIPIDGVRSSHFSDWISYEHTTVDVNSITIREADIPESLFEIDFPAGAVIYNAASGLTTVKGRPFKTYEQVVSAGSSYIAGTVSDEKGTPIRGVAIGPCAVKTNQNVYKLIQVHDRPCATTDTKGRFAIELEEEGMYDLLFCAQEHVDTRIRDVPLGRRGLKVRLSKGGIVEGRLVRLVKGVKVPVSNFEVEAKEQSTIPLAFIRRHRLSATTDAEGRFQIKYLETLTPKRRTSVSEPEQYVPLAWQISCGSVAETVQFENGKSIQEVELVLTPTLEEAEPLMGRALPDFEGIRIDLVGGQTRDKVMLVCFLDMNQRPSRNCMMQLAKQAERLRQKDVAVIAVEASKAAERTLNEWVRQNNVPFAVGITEGDADGTRFSWGARSLPWLVLTDKNHVVTAEGFSIAELADKLKGSESPKAVEENEIEASRSQDSSGWKNNFERVYRLGQGEVLKRIAPPFIPERRKYLAEEMPRYYTPGQAEPLPAVIFQWDGHLTRSSWSCSAGYSLAAVLQAVIGLEYYEFELAPKLQYLLLTGDWIVRKDSTVEDRLKAFELILKNQIGKEIRFARRRVSRPLIIATGSFRFHPLSGTYDDSRLHFFAEALDPARPAHQREHHTLISANSVPSQVGRLAGLQVSNQTEPSDETMVRCSFHRSAYLAGVKDWGQKNRKLNLLLANITSQTGLKFAIKRQTAELWSVTELKRSEDGSAN